MAIHDDSPYRKAAAKLPVRFASVPRKRRALLVALLLAIAIFVLFKLITPSQTLLFFLFSPDVAGPYGSEHYPNSGTATNNHHVNDILQFIDPLIGTTNGGHVFPGATLPYGMAKAVADVASPAENAAGFVSDDNPITGFSHMHDSGTGGQPSLGNFPLFVHPGCIDDDYTKCDFSLHDRPLNRVPGSVYASPGYFTVNITNGVRAEMTTTHHAVLYRFSFPGTEKLHFAKGVAPYSPLILVDLVDLMNSRSMGGIQVYPETGRIVGDGRYMPSFGAGHYHAFFCADFKGAKIRKTGTFVSNNATDAKQFLGGVGSGYQIPTGSAGAWIQFERPDSEDLILARVGVSFISVDKACENAEQEIGEDWDFERVEKDAREAWREKLDVVRVDARGTSEELQATFWSGLYRTLLSPQNYTGENPLWNSSEPYFDSFYCIWDSFRAQHPLLTVIDPKAQAEMIRALIDIYRHEGKLPDCRMSFCKGYTQGGSNADVVIADAFIKGLTADIDWKTAYEAVLSDAEIEPQDWGLSGRGNLVSWHERGYIPLNDVDKNGTGPASRSISRGVEYAYNDFCISLLAHGLSKSPSLLGGAAPSSSSSSSSDIQQYHPNISTPTPWTSLTSDITKYHHRGANWRNYWNPTAKDLFRDRSSSPYSPQEQDTPISGQNTSVPGYILQSPFVGFLQPRTLSGTFRYHPTRTCSPIQNQHSCYYDTSLDVYEGSPWLYSFYAPQSMSTLISLMGGAQTFVERLEYYHESGIAYMGNEQSFLTVFQFHYAGRPGLSSKWLRSYVPSMFNASVNGIPGNDDCAMGAFTTWGMGLGVFPVAGQDVYLIVPPFFREVKVRAGMDLKALSSSSSGPMSSRDSKKAKWAVIRTVNFDGEMQGDGSGKPVYIQSAKLNGKRYTRNWITHKFFEKGGLLELVVGPDESKTWGTSTQDLPPSYYEDAKFWDEWERMDREKTERWKEGEAGSEVVDGEY